jgi:predicted regulator of Ras-like GTPase activity (Roadblock/LC7/MglB family)
MFRAFKSFVRKLVAEDAPENSEPSAAPVEHAPIAAEPAYEPAAPFVAPKANSKAKPLAKIGNAAPQNQNGKGVHLPLQTILATLPLEVQPKVRRAEVGDRTVAVPLDKILAQLSRGVVTITFGELRSAAPDVFAPDTDRDKSLISLPLNDIISRLNPALITRRRVQRTVEVPDHISSPFDSQGQGLVFSTAPSKAEPAPAPARQTQPAQPVQPVAPVIPARTSITSAPTPPPPSAIPMPSTMTSAARALREMSTPKPVVAPTPAPIPMSAPVPMAAPVPAAPPVKAASDTDRLAMAASAAPSEPPKPAAADQAPLLASLTSLAEGWPEGVRREIVESNLVDSRVALPHDTVKQGLKQGKIACTWKTVRSWINSPSAAVSPNDSTVLELPLKVVAPLFLSRQQEAQKSQQKVAVDVEIPNLFFGFPQAENGSSAEVGGVAGITAASTARPGDTNYYVWSDTDDTARVDAADFKRNPSPGTRFVAKYATPNEVVSRAAALEGVAGALIALPDGLMVANQLPADFNADTIAAFLPQIFGKVSSCTKELRMGDLNNLNFTVGNIPWKIFRVNAIFFAAFGRTGQPLPTGQLAALAAELDHKPR